MGMFSTVRAYGAGCAIVGAGESKWLKIRQIKFRKGCDRDFGPTGRPFEKCRILSKSKKWGEPFSETTLNSTLTFE
jgi:hypothetical protein